MIPLLLLFFWPGAAPETEAGKIQPRRDTIVVTGTFEPVPLEEADRSVDRLDVEGQPLLLGSLADVLRLIPSVDLRERAPGGVQADVSIRGGTFGQTLVLLDGLRMNDIQSGHHNMDLPVPMESVADVEVLRGSGSALYGSDAVGGVVNVVTRKPEAGEVRLRAGVGNFGTNAQSVSIAAVKKRISQHLAASRDFSSGFAPNRDYRSLSLASRSYFESAWGSSTVLLAHGDRPFGAQNFYGNFPSWERTKTWFAALRQDLGARTEASFAFRRHTDLFVLYRDRPQVFTNRHAVESYQGALRRREEAGRNTQIHFGAEVLGDTITSNNLGHHRRARGAAYAALDMRAVRRFSFSLAAREEIHGPLRSQLSPTAAAGVWLSQRIKLRASASRAFRLPSYTDLYYHDPANRGSPDLRPETAWSYDAGADWNAGSRLGGEVTVFHRRERDGIDYVRSTPAELWRATNIQRLEFTGAEVAVVAGLGGSHRLDVRYTGLRGVQRALAGLESRYVFQYPVHAGVASWMGSLPGGLAGRVRLGATRRYARDPYAVLDASVARMVGRVRPFLQFINLADAGYEEIRGVPMPGRGVLGGVAVILSGGTK
jgi:iron complex outermembrane recepter protein